LCKFSCSHFININFMYQSAFFTYTYIDTIRE